MDNETSTEGFREAFLHDFISSRRASFTNARGKKFLRILLDDVRGRVILFLGGTDIGIDLLQGMSPTAAGRQAGRLKRLTTACMTKCCQVGLNRKVDDCCALLDRAKLDLDVNHGYSTWWNMSMAFFWNPIHFALWATPKIQKLYTTDKCGKDGQYGFGWVLFGQRRVAVI